MSTEGRLPHPFHVLVKPRGAVCNLGCAYCYYLGKEALYPGSDFRMPESVLEEFTRQYIAAQPIPEVTFGWQGGEPTLMGLGFFRRAVELQERYRPRGMRIHNALQTNGTTLDGEWCEFLRRHDFLVGLSLDGPAPLHDRYRRDRAGRPTFERAMAGVRALQEHGVEYNILTTVHAANAGHPLEVYRTLRDEAGARFIQFIPIVEVDGAAGTRGLGDEHDDMVSSSPDHPIPAHTPHVSSRSVTPEQHGAFLSTIFDEWVRRDVGQVFIQAFDAALAAWMGERPGMCVYEETCGHALALEHNGDLYACDHFVEPAHRLGNILETPLAELAASERQERFGLAKRDGLPHACQECQVRFACRGGCPKDRFLSTPEGEPGLNYLCAGYRAFYRHIDRPMRLMAEELRAGRPAAGIMLRLAGEEAAREQRFTSARRNDPCPCGSGLKYKHCHGRRGGEG